MMARLPAASAATWTGAASTDWFDPANWSPPATPDATTNVVIDQGTPNANPSIGINGTGNAAASAAVEIGDLSGTTGLVTLSTTNAHPASWTITGNLQVGESGTGTINISNAATLTNTTSQTLIGSNSSGIGSVTVDGVGTLWNEQATASSIGSAPIVVGNSGMGTLTITNGAVVETTGNLGHFVIGFNAGSHGTVAVGSASSPNPANPSTLTNNFGLNGPGSLFVGYMGTGTLTVNSDGVVNGFDGGALGAQAGGHGTVTVNGGLLDVTAGNAASADSLTIGGFGLGTLTVQNGGMVTSASASIADQAGSAGSSVTVTGTGSTWNIGGGLTGLTVGNSDTGSLSVLAGGAVIISGGVEVNIGGTTGANGTGTVLVDNATLRANGSFIQVGVLGNPGSTMTVQNGGTVASDGGSIGGGGVGFSSTGVVTVTGAGSLWDAARDVNGNVDAFNSQLLIDNPVSMTGLVIRQGGQVIDGFGSVGDSSPNGTVNTVTVDGVGSKWTNLSQLTIGLGLFNPNGFGPGGSTGVVNITGGAQVSAPSISIGLLPDGSNVNIDRISVSGAGSNLQASGGTIVVGQFGTGALSVSGGATVSDASGIVGFSSAAPGSLVLNQFGGIPLDTNNVGANSVGTVIVTGAGSTWSNSTSLIVGQNANTDANFTGIGGGTATATLTIADGATVSVNGGAGTVSVAVNAGATGTINIGAAHGSAAVAPGTISAAEILFGAGTGSIVFNHTSTNYSFGASIQGAGTVDVESGTTVLTAISTYTGATAINGGTLSVNGSIAGSNVTVNAGGTLGGNGTVGNTTVNGGTLAPGSVAGSAFGPLTVQGNLSFTAASTYVIQVTPADAGRTNAVGTGAPGTGTATLGGATVNAVFAAGAYVSKQYTIVNAAGGVLGTFSALVNTNLPASVSPSLSYDANDAFLNISINFSIPGGLNANQQNVGNALTNFFNATGSIPVLFAALTPAGLTQASGELATGSQQTTFDAMNLFMGVMTDPFFGGHGDGATGGTGATPFAERQGGSAYASDGKPRSNKERDAYAAIYSKAPPADTFAQRWSVWAAGYGGSQTTDGNATVGSNTATSRIFGTAVGADYRFSPFTLAGFALAGGGTNFSVNGLGSGRSDLFQAGVYIRHTVGPAYITAALAYGWQNITTDRFVTIAGVDHLRAEFNADAFSGRLEGGYRFVTPWMGVTPYAAAQVTTFDLPAYAESALSGANTFVLAYGAKSATDTRSELGLRSDKSFAMTDSIFTLRGRAAWVHDYNPDRAIGATFQTLPGASFVVNGAAQASDAALVTVSAETKWMNGWSAAATFEGEFSDVTRSYAGKAVVRFAW